MDDGLAREQAALDQVTTEIIRTSGLRALWMESWSDTPCPIAMQSSMTICDHCGQPNVRVGSAYLHAGDPRLVLLGVPHVT